MKNFLACLALTSSIAYAKHTKVRYTIDYQSIGEGLPTQMNGDFEQHGTINQVADESGTYVFSDQMLHVPVDWLLRLDTIVQYAQVKNWGPMAVDGSGRELGNVQCVCKKNNGDWKNWTCG